MMVPTEDVPMDPNMTLAERLIYLQKKRAAERAVQEKEETKKVKMTTPVVVSQAKSAVKKEEDQEREPPLKKASNPYLKDVSVPEAILSRHGVKKRCDGKDKERNRDGHKDREEEKDTGSKRSKLETTEIKLEGLSTVREGTQPNSQDTKTSEINGKKEVKKDLVKFKKDPFERTHSVPKKNPAKKSHLVPKKDPAGNIHAPVVFKKDPNIESQSQKDEEEGMNGDDEEYKWWEEQNNDGTAKWTTLIHNGLYFPPPYESHGIPMHYEGKEIHLEPAAEEVATFFAAIIGTDHYENEIFRNNFFEDFQQVLRQCSSRWAGLVKDLDKCDFTRIHAHLMQQREAKKSLSKEEKERLKLEKALIDEKYGWCILDGRKEKVGNFRVEPPGLFRGRGKHPKAGKLKLRVTADQITINIGADAAIPEAPEGYSWGKVVHDPTVTWLASWTENVNKMPKYVFLAAGSSLKGQSDLKKFETARELNQHVGKIRRVNAEELRSKEMLVRQRATALWLIDRLALRAGNEKGDDEADTVGCCSLRCEHVRLQEPNIVIFDFLGKDSIRYYNEIPVDHIIFKNLGIFMRKPKVASDLIFDRLQTSTLNKYLSSLMPGLTAKVFRTYNASHTFQQELDKTPAEGTVHDHVLAYNRANRQVAILCNHQRSVPKTHQQSMEKLSEKILTMKYQRYLTRKELREAVTKKELKEECPDALEEESDMDDQTIKRKALEAEETEKAKLEKAGKSPDASSQSPTKRKRSSKEQLIKRFASLTGRIEAAKNQRIDRDENKTTALGTSKTNYLDPRITVAWCEKHKVPIEKMFNKSLREKFKWAMTVGPDWRFDL